jgi:hypothetical protein
MSQAETAVTPPRLRRWRRWLALLVVVTTLAVFHRPLLWLAALALVVDEPADRAEVVVIIGAQRDYDQIADRNRAGAHILLVREKPGRLERLGVVPTIEEITRRELTSRNVPVSALSVACAEPWDETGFARAVRAWLTDHPGSRAIILANRLSSRRMRWCLNSELGKEADRASVKSVAHPWYDETNWWHRKEGLSSVVHGYLGLGWLLAFGESPDFGEADVETIRGGPAE